MSEQEQEGVVTDASEQMPDAAEATSGEQLAQGAGQDGADAPAEAGSSSSAEEGADQEASRLDEEGDAAADYLEELLDIADLDGDIDIEVRDSRVYVSITAEEGEEEQLEALVGRDGATLEALQELTRLAVLADTGQRSRFVLDIAGHRARRAEDLSSIAAEAIESVRSSGEPAALASSLAMLTSPTT